MKIGFYNLQGGTGKTTIAANMAYYISDVVKTVFVDCDIYGGNSALFFNMESVPETINGYLNGEYTVGEIIHEYENLSVIVSDPTPGAFDTDLDVEKLVDLLNQLEEKYDVIILDLPPNITEGNILFSNEELSCKMIVVGEDSIPGIGGTLKTLELLDALNIQVIGTIINKDRKIVDYEDVIDNVISILPYDEEVEEQWIKGEPIVKKKSHFGKELSFLIEELLEAYIQKDLATLRAIEIAKEFKSHIMGEEEEEEEKDQSL
ncbi:MAG TPA: MinD/ParA family protein [Methanothermococcus okinawensis]|uniref:MinD/ParA family protein n=1 Tax=Methanothermococcus okinawensis TaxID=155863 RepID=A0A832ZYD2_9EURY|nr:MinD/ParA family protein [Methanothermococcus okinawensis]